MKWKPYSKYKDSGVEWLGEVPEHWEIYRLNKSVRLVNEKTDGPLADVLYLGLESVEPGTGRQLEPEVPLQPEGTSNRFREGHVLFGKLRPYLAKAIIAKTHGTCSSEFLVLDPKLLGERVLLYWLLSDGFLKQVDSSTYGAKMPRASWDYIGSLPVPLAPETEQTRIAHFLDRETAKIDALVAKQERLIELLQEKRQALISHAVTKGLNPDASMKPSGIHWLGDVPAHWDVASLKRQARRIDVGIAEAATHAYVLEDEKDAVPILRSTNVRANTISRELFFISGSFAASRSSKRLRVNDIVTVRTGNAGVSAVVPDHLDGCHCFTMLITTLAGNCDPAFCSYFLNSTPAQAYFTVEGWGAAQANISVPILADTPLPVPPLAEQVEIVGHITSVSSSLQKLIDRARQAIALMREHRTALISAAVTGKIDVREVHQAAHA